MPKNIFKNNSLTERQKMLLKIVIEYYIQNVEAIGSHSIQDRGFKNISSATIRNEMVVLEKKGYIVKEHFTSGRIPTKSGYQYYLFNLIDGQLSNDFLLLKKNLAKILADRHFSIDQCIEKSAKIITEFINLPIVVSKQQALKTELLKKIDIVNISNEQFMIFFITSSSTIYKHFITIENSKQGKDIEICIRLFNEKLIDLPIIEVINKIQELKLSIRKYVHQYEFIFENLILQILKNLQEKVDISYKIYNQKSLIKHPEFQKDTLFLEKAMELLENNSVFSSLAQNYLKTGQTLVNFENNIDGLSVAMTKIEHQHSQHQISIIGPIRMNYPLIQYLLKYLNEKLTNKKQIN